MLWRRFIDTVENAFQIALDNVQRRAQLVGDIGGEVAPLLVIALQLRHHLVKGVGQAAKVALAPFRHTYTQVAGRHCIGGGHDIGKRCRHAAEGAHRQRNADHWQTEG